MKTNLLKFQWLFILLMGMFIVSCTDSSNTAADADEYAEETVFRTQESTNLGRFGCYELVFPVTFNFPDGTTADVDSYDALKAEIKDWRNENPKVRIRPSLALPYSVINASGEMITAETVEEQRELKIACAKDFFNNHDPKGHNDRPKLCFRMVFPFSLTMPNGTIFSISSKEDLKRLHIAIKEWRKNHPDSKVRPTLVFPITVKMEDGSFVVVNSKQELKALKDSCK